MAALLIEPIQCAARAATPAEKPMLRFTTAGSVDDGKSTLIGRILHDAVAQQSRQSFVEHPGDHRIDHRRAVCRDRETFELVQRKLSANSIPMRGETAGRRNLNWIFSGLLRGGVGQYASSETALRAVLMSGQGYSFMKAMHGSLKDAVPGEAELGAVLVNHVERTAGPRSWDDIMSRAARTLGGDIGRSGMRIPMASRIALATAARGGTIGTSPTPRGSGRPPGRSGHRPAARPVPGRR